MADLLIHDGIVITMDPQRRVLDSTSIAIADGRIIDIGPASELSIAAYRDKDHRCPTQGRVARNGRSPCPYGRRSSQDHRRGPRRIALAELVRICVFAHERPRLVAGRNAHQRAGAAQIRRDLHLHPIGRQRHAHRRGELHRTGRARARNDRHPCPHRPGAGPPAVAAAVLVLEQRKTHQEARVVRAGGRDLQQHPDAQSQPSVQARGLLRCAVAAWQSEPA